ncbi:hypothetical protein BX667DRAFT_502522 [Coemansia mojavensis]|nr:hypothetical protein BX667DRAFT_502522 [Coemansia mojavensis]
MARRFSRSLSWALFLLYWLLVAGISLAPLLAFWKLLSVVLDVSAIPPHEVEIRKNNGEILCYPKWDEPFEYGVKVYASSQKYGPTYAAEFFNSAQLLWHIESANSTIPPKFADNVELQVPGSMRYSGNANSTIYVHMFIQKAGKLSPHPDPLEPTMLYSSAKLVYWRPSKTNVNDSMGFELVYMPEISWAINLENHVFGKGCNSMSITAKGSMNSSTITEIYSPPLAVNTLTKNLPEPKQLNLIDDLYLPIHLELEAVSLKLFKLQHVLDYCINIASSISNDVPDFAEFNRYIDTVKTRSAIILALVAGFFLCVFSATFLHMVTSILFWIGPKSRWEGVSRISFFMDYMGSFLHGLKDAYAGQRPMGTMLSLNIYSMAIMTGMAFEPWRWPQLAIQKIKSYRQLHNVGDSSEAKDDKQQLVDIRNHVDAQAWNCLSSILLPTVLAITMHKLSTTTANWWSTEFLSELFSTFAYVLHWLDFWPQVVLNYRARRGSSIPVIISFGKLASGVFLATAMYLLGYDYLPSFCELPCIAQEIIFIVQWLKYK